MTASDLLIWGIVAHLIADWPLQNDWMARNKASLRHPAGYVHAGIHGLLLALVFGWAAAPLAVAHLLIDTRVPVVCWSRLVRQTQPADAPHFLVWYPLVQRHEIEHADSAPRGAPMLVDVGTEVRFWTDQVFHIACLAVASRMTARLIIGILLALLVGCLEALWRITVDQRIPLGPR
jgi:hypothetical protein